MKTFLQPVAFLVFSTLTLGAVCSCTTSPNQQEKASGFEVIQTNDIFDKGQPAPSEWFTGPVNLNVLMQPTETMQYSIGDVKFEPGSRTLWHTHPVEQVLLVTDGNGYYQERDKPAVKLTKGDVFVIPADVEHWHGAAPDSPFTHIAITNYKEGSNVTWLSPVTEDEYGMALN